MQELESFIRDWQETEEGNRAAFTRLKDCLLAKEGVKTAFQARPGVTYSLRGAHPKQDKRPLFVMIDVIEDQPRWLSVCFYGEMITDPDGKGDFVPGGLLGEDAICFDLERAEEETLTYIEERIGEAYTAAA